jgi:hypothetical protein
MVFPTASRASRIIGIFLAQLPAVRETEAVEICSQKQALGRFYRSHGTGLEQRRSGLKRREMKRCERAARLSAPKAAMSCNIRVSTGRSSKNVSILKGMAGPMRDSRSLCQGLHKQRFLPYVSGFRG